MRKANRALLLSTGWVPHAPGHARAARAGKQVARAAPRAAAKARMPCTAPSHDAVTGPSLPGFGPGARHGRAHCHPPLQVGRWGGAQAMPQRPWLRSSPGTAIVDRFRSQLSISRLASVEEK
ncbi:hypothetical protein GCM10009601_63110 [Streptomyces thermospinosisporus]|uniref:Secreted protein n=1 Tax=Streptomyces thermospinosisporus TaxID=161482 RepID=A0ABN1Z7Q3_9ACTN